MQQKRQRVGLFSALVTIAGKAAGNLNNQSTYANWQKMAAADRDNRKNCHPIIMRWFALPFAAVLLASTLHAQSRCPGNAHAIPFRNINQHQMLVSVSINHSGPYDFLLDTGTQMTVVDRSLADGLRVPMLGRANVAGVTFQGEAMFARLDSLEVGDHVSANLGVLVYDMKDVQAAGFAIRGLLGEDFLSRFDVLIDNSHNRLCLDDTGAMRGGLTQGN